MSAFVSTLASTLVGVLAGGVITWICARVYYERSSQELKQEARRLRSHLKILLFGLHDAGVIDLSWDPRTDLPVAIRLQNLRLPGMVGNPSVEVTSHARSTPSGSDHQQGAPETVEEGPEGAEPRSGAGGAQEGVQRPQERPWWRRMFR